MAPSRCIEPPNSPIFAEAPNSLGFLYSTFKTEDSLSPYFGCQPPAENDTEDTKSLFIKLRPSCCPLLTKKGLYMGMSLT